MNGQDDATHLVELDRLSRKLEKQRDRLARIAQSYIDDLDDSGDEAGAKGIRRWVADIFSENVLGHAPAATQRGSMAGKESNHE